MFPQFLFVLYFALVFVSAYFNYFTSSLKEEAAIDADYLVCSSTVESEKEITAFDDMILAFVILLYVFGWYFYIHCWSLVCAFPELIFLFYLFPCLYFIIFGIPTILAYIFGIQFLVYLRGVSSSPSLAAELMFDYIGVVVFYVRILIQGVRLVLMLLTLASLNELIMHWSIPQKALICPEYFWEELSKVSLTLSSLSYFFLCVLPGQIVYLIFEVGHTYFLCSIQFVAFFAIVFWLYLFFYTMFISEKQEDYLSYLRKKYTSSSNSQV